MPYTLSMTALWLLLAALLGCILGWLLHTIFHSRKPHGPVGVPQDEADRLRHRIANLEPAVAERDKLKARVGELESDLKLAKAAPLAAPIVHGISQVDHDAVVTERDRLQIRVGELEGELSAAQAAPPVLHGIAHVDHEAVVAERDRLAALVQGHESTIGSLRADLESRPQAFAGIGAADLERGTSVFGKAIKMDDLKIVEGIGPVLEGVFHGAGITTWAALAESAPERLREILVSADERHRIHNPTTWPRQARLANLGEFEALKAWQDILSSGKE